MILIPLCPPIGPINVAYGRIGIVNLPLVDVLSNASQVSGLYALENGVGYGRVSLSLLFKAVDISLPRSLQGWDTGTVCVTTHVRIESTGDYEFGEKKLIISTLGQSSA